MDNACRSGAVDAADRVALQGSNGRRTATLEAAADNLELLDLSRAFDPDGGAAGGRSAYVRITRGCNKFCTYCVVPATRGAEVHRPPDAIIEECRRLADRGVIEITLLGQTVNHYRYTHGAALTLDGREAPQVGPGLSAFRKAPVAGQRTTTFAMLLSRIHEEVPELHRIRFVTSYPRDLGEDVFDVLAASPRICRYLHMPVQSGSDRVLKAMNRGYTVSEYLETVDRAIERLPDVSIAGDIIVGFPTETDEDFHATEALLRRVPFKNNFIFKYSPRPGTAAFDRLPDDVPDEVKRYRNNRLLSLQAEVSGEVHRKEVGRTLPVLFDRVGSIPLERAKSDRPTPGGVELRVRGRETEGSTVSHPDSRRWQALGRTSGDLIVAVDVDDPAVAEGMLGTIAPVEITSAESLLLHGTASLPVAAGSP